MDSPQRETSLTEDAVQTIGGPNTRADKSDSPGRRNEIFASTPTLRPKYVHSAERHHLRRSPYALLGRHRQLQSGRIQHPHQRFQSRVSLARERAVERLAAQAAPLGHEPEAMRRRDRSEERRVGEEWRS